MIYLQLLSINILNSRYKFIFSIIVYLLVYFCYYTNIAYNMGNCCGRIPIEDPAQNTDILQSQQRFFQHISDVLQRENQRLIVENNQLRIEVANLSAAYAENQTMLEHTKNDMQSFINELSDSTFAEEAAHMETYRKLQNCLREKANLEQNS